MSFDDGDRLDGVVPAQRIDQLAMLFVDVVQVGDRVFGSARAKRPEEVP
jgi:hypothetical protein